MECTCGYCAECCDRRWEENEAEWRANHDAIGAEFQAYMATMYHDVGELTPAEELEQKARG